MLLKEQYLPEESRTALGRHEGKRINELSHAERRLSEEYADRSIVLFSFIYKQNNALLITCTNSSLLWS